MAERFTLTTAETIPEKRTTYYRVARVSLNWVAARIDVDVLGENGELRGFVYEGVVATNLMVALNTADLSVKSLHRRILERLAADGRLVGAVTGAPD